MVIHNKEPSEETPCNINRKKIERQSTKSHYIYTKSKQMKGEENRNESLRNETPDFCSRNIRITV